MMRCKNRIRERENRDCQEEKMKEKFKNEGA